MKERSDYGWAALIGIPFGLAIAFGLNQLRLPSLAYIGYIFAAIGACCGLAWLWLTVAALFRKR